MSFCQETLHLGTQGRGFYEITSALADLLCKSALQQGLAHAFCRHTSCSLVLMENADPTARADLERFLSQLIPDGTGFAHTLEGPDDMPSHIRMALTRSSETIPFRDGRLQLGTWQGLYLWEHRLRPHPREVILTLMGEG